MAQRRTPNKEQHSTDHSIGQTREASMPVDGDARIIQDKTIDVVDGPNAMTKANALAFNEEKIKVLVHESTEQGASAVVFAAVNGKKQFMIRGIPQVVRRKYVESLARAKQTSYRQVVTVSESTGNVVQKMIPRTALKNPFSIIEDLNPYGPAWLRQILNEA